MEAGRFIPRRRPGIGRLALVVWVYAGGGQAEFGVVPFLQQHFPSVTFRRRLPERKKKGPRPGVAIAYGATGQSLAQEIIRSLSNHGQDEADVVFVLDDADCDDPTTKTTALRQAVEKGLAEATRNGHAVRPASVVVGLAVPELEAWLLADWNNTFAKRHSNCHHALRFALSQAGVDLGNVEAFDCRCETPAYRKISEVLQEGFNACCPSGVRYSKDTDTRALLANVDPARVSQTCPAFRTFWNDLKQATAPTL